MLSKILVGIFMFLVAGVLPATVVIAWVILPTVRRFLVSNGSATLLNGTSKWDGRTKAIAGTLGSRNARVKLYCSKDNTSDTTTLELMPHNATLSWSWALRLTTLEEDSRRPASPSPWDAVDGVSPAPPLEFAAPDIAPEVVCSSNASAWQKLPAALRSRVARTTQDCRADFQANGQILVMTFPLRHGMDRVRRAFEVMAEVAGYYENPHSYGGQQPMVGTNYRNPPTIERPHT